MTNREQAHQLIDSVPEGELGEIIDILQARQKRAERQLDAETKAWMEADLAPPLEPYDWGDEDPMKGDPVVWDTQRGAFMVKTSDAE